MTFSQHEGYSGTVERRVYRNPSMAAVLGVFSAIVLGLIIKSAFTGSSSSTGLRVFAVVLVVVLGSYVLRALLVELRISPDGVKIRNIFTTRRIPWNEIAEVKPIDARGNSLSNGSTVAFCLTDGRVLRPMALRRSLGDAIAISKDLTQIAANHGASMSPRPAPDTRP